MAHEEDVAAVKRQTEIVEAHRRQRTYAGQGFLALEEAVNLILDGGHIKEGIEEITSARKWFRTQVGVTEEQETELISEASEINAQVEAAERAAGWDPNP